MVLITTRSLILLILTIIRSRVNFGHRRDQLFKCYETNASNEGSNYVNNRIDIFGSILQTLLLSGNLPGQQWAGQEIRID